ncbi:TetR/AcrR family transcriptional regulator [Streptococcaceae bacterium ESL0687]|nr:TetR/AcrR family transcriptional regulator [Streptococcaceae bacterium ESL0687]
MSDLRFERTEKLLHLSFLELLETSDFNDITVARLARKSLINRTTFYAHYENISELAQSLINQYLDHLEEVFEENFKNKQKQKTFDSYSFFTNELISYFQDNRREINLLRNLNLGQDGFDSKLRSLFSQIYTKTFSLEDDDFATFLLTNIAFSNVDFILDGRTPPTRDELKKSLLVITDSLK